MKQFFFQEDESLLAHTRRIAQIYKDQPLRTRCKACDEPLAGKRFSKQEIAYILCIQCDHLNGAHEDTENFTRAIYTEEESEIFSIAYSPENAERFNWRVREVYEPKVQFLFEGLRHAGEEPESLAYCDVGAGSGYFISALRNSGIQDVVGFEVSSSLVNIANTMIGDAIVKKTDVDQIEHEIENSKADVLNLIFVLEHIRDPRGILAAAARNPRVRYVYMPVPLFSPSVFFEAAFPSVFHRQLSAGHTHLFTEKSLARLCNWAGMEGIAEWWFGSDATDLFRLMLLSFNRSEDTVGLAEVWQDRMMPILDDLQTSLDRRRMSSEVHLLARVVRD